MSLLILLLGKPLLAAVGLAGWTFSYRLAAEPAAFDVEVQGRAAIEDVQIVPARPEPLEIEDAVEEADLVEPPQIDPPAPAPEDDEIEEPER